MGCSTASARSSPISRRTSAPLAAGRGIEWDLTLVEGLFRLLATRFDQSRDPALASTLRAADELIWSCVQQTRVLTDEPPPLPPPPPLPLPLPQLATSAASSEMTAVTGRVGRGARARHA